MGHLPAVKSSKTKSFYFEGSHTLRNHWINMIPRKQKTGRGIRRKWRKPNAYGNCGGKISRKLVSKILPKSTKREISQFRKAMILIRWLQKSMLLSQVLLLYHLNLQFPLINQMIHTIFQQPMDLSKWTKHWIIAKSTPVFKWIGKIK